MILAPTFADSRLVRDAPSTGSDWLGLAVGAVIAIIGISIAYRVWIVKPGTSTKLRERFALPYTLFVNKWYFDELIDFVVVRPAQLTGRFAQTVLDGGLIAGGVTGGTTGVARALSAIVRRGQTGFLRYYVALMIVGIGAVALYFLIAST